MTLTFDLLDPKSFLDQAASRSFITSTKFGDPMYNRLDLSRSKI